MIWFSTTLWLPVLFLGTLETFRLCICIWNQSVFSEFILFLGSVCCSARSWLILSLRSFFSFVSLLRDARSNQPASLFSWASMDYQKILYSESLNSLSHSRWTRVIKLTSITLSGSSHHKSLVLSVLLGEASITVGIGELQSLHSMYLKKFILTVFFFSRIIYGTTVCISFGFLEKQIE